MILSNEESQAPKELQEAEPSHLARYLFADKLIKEDSEILDIPCGSGYGSGLLSQTAKKVVGIDIHKEAIQHADEFFKKNNNSFKVGDMENLKTKEGIYFDVIVSFEGIEHIWKQEKFLKTAKNLLKPGGLLIISTPRKPHGSPYHTIEFSLDEFKEFLSKEFLVKDMFGQVYTDFFNLKNENKNPHEYERFNFIAICQKKT